MSKSSSSSNWTIVNLCSVVAVVLSIIIWVIQLISQVDALSGIRSINGILDKIKDVLLMVAVLSSAFSYALGMKQNGWRIFVMACCIICAILTIVGVFVL